MWCRRGFCCIICLAEDCLNIVVIKFYEAYIMFERATVLVFFFNLQLNKIAISLILIRCMCFLEI